jgi:hypothetical protein
MSEKTMSDKEFAFGFFLSTLLLAIALLIMHYNIVMWKVYNQCGTIPFFALS